MSIAIKNLNTTTTFEADDYVVIDGETGGTRKILVPTSPVLYDQAEANNRSQTINCNGISSLFFRLEVSTEHLSLLDASKITAYLITDDADYYPLHIINIRLYSTSPGATVGYMDMWVKNFFGRFTNSEYYLTNVTGYIHFVAPFPINSVNIMM